MFRNSTFTALFISSAIGAFAAPACADNSGGVVIPEGHGTRIEWASPWPPGAEVRDHRTGGQSEVVVVGQGDYECGYGVIQLILMGYEFITPTDCEGAVYNYTAMDGASFFHAAMSSHSGEIRVEFRGMTN